MDLVDLRYLSITVETGSLLHAAQSLGVKAVDDQPPHHQARG